MKCLILAGGRGERLWPLSRKNYPKQFIQIQRNHSIFQETVARNMPYCDEFVIVTSYEYRYIIESQMTAFQGVTYRCVYEENPCGTAMAITLACMEFQPSELVFVVTSSHLIDVTEQVQYDALNYQEAILNAKKLAMQGEIAVFRVNNASLDAMGNIGLLLFENGLMQRELEKKATVFYTACKEAFEKRSVNGSNILYLSEAIPYTETKSIEKLLLENSCIYRNVVCGFSCLSIEQLEDISKTEYAEEGVNVVHQAKETIVINNCPDKAVVVNNADELLVVNTQDAVYVGKYGKSSELKEIFSEYEELRTYIDKGTVFYRSWGYYQQLFEERNYRIRRVVIYPGKTIYAHSHNHRSENWTLVQGNVCVILNGIKKNYGPTDNIDIPIGMVHQISNIGINETIFVETACGEIIREQDMIGVKTNDLNENQLGIQSEPFIKLAPTFKDYLWGGTKLRDIYQKKCDYNTIAESWELSAHPAGQSIVASGRHKGLMFKDYLKTVGKVVLGWKCQSMKEFPILIKFIDAKEDLSVQVHPDDDYAFEKEHENGKNEMWYVLDCEPGSVLYIGFNQDVSRDEVEQRIKENTILDILNKVETNPGDVFFIPSGIVHAIGAGNLICEVQQNSNCTYRLYDYERCDKWGNCRELHLKDALEVLKYRKHVFSALKTNIKSKSVTVKGDKYFEVEIVQINGTYIKNIDDSRFVAFVCLEGNGIVQCSGIQEDIKKGESVFVKANICNLRIDGICKIMFVHV